jgi:hypothetical protein
MRCLPFLLLACACAHDAAIRADDPVFARAQARYEKTLAAVPEPRGADARLFIQGESFFRYRYAFVPPSAGSYLAQAAASFTEFAPLVALTSEDAFELRRAGYNGSARLYETLLDRFPESPYAPLARWRLGFAYRNADEGDSDEAFDALAAKHPATGLAKLVPEAKAMRRKSPGVATGLSIIPGVGQMYAGEKLNGAVRLGIALAFAALALVPVYLLVQKPELNWLYIGGATAGILGLQVSYTAAYQDAVRAAIEFNEAREAEFEDAHAEAP